MTEVLMPTADSRRYRGGALAIAVLTLTVLGARPTGAQVPELQSTVDGFLDQVGGAVMQVMRSDGSTAAADMAAARVLLDQLQTLSVDPAARQALGPAAPRFARLVHGMDGALR